MGRKHSGKGEIAHYEQWFQKTSRLLQADKNQGLYEKGLIHTKEDYDMQSMSEKRDNCQHQTSSGSMRK